MITYCIKNLNNIKAFLYQLDETKYTHNCESLSGASIGQHVRHILEFYVCLLEGAHSGLINYDNRRRNLQMESDKKFAVFSIENICTNIEFLPSGMKISHSGNYCQDDDATIVTESSIEREMVYCLEHAIHHMALIKVAAIEQSIDNLLDEDFGIAPSTIRNRKNLCVQ